MYGDGETQPELSWYQVIGALVLTWAIVSIARDNMQFLNTKKPKTVA